MTETLAGQAPKDAAPSVVAQHAAMLDALPFSDTADFDDAARGFLGTIENAHIANPQGRVVWSLEPYGFLSSEDAPATVNPSLWRQSRLNMRHGLFEVVPGVYQVRGLDIANMTLIEGDAGVIVVDTLTSIEGARAASADAGFTLARATLDEIIAKLTTFPEAVAAGKIAFVGNPMRLAELMSLLDEFPRMFEIVEPKRVIVR
jgi:alkyl sulfatase BDS1-like metallo-beta-lactamase superfamily hydrolase